MCLTLKSKIFCKGVMILALEQNKTLVTTFSSRHLSVKVHHWLQFGGRHAVKAVCCGDSGS